MNWELGTDVCVLPDIKQIVGTTVQHRELSLVLCVDLERWEGG